MGCDIHGIIEKRNGWGWVNCGDPEIGRNYDLFAILGNVRNSDNIPFIGEKRGIPEDCCLEYQLLSKYWGEDAHSHSWVTLREVEGFNLKQRYYNSRPIMEKDAKGKVLRTCGGTTGKHLGTVGECEIFEVWGRKAWYGLLHHMTLHGLPDAVRLMFFFDN